jgi:penicillin-insensitive murein DD-endopeptidase
MILHTNLPHVLSRLLLAACAALSAASAQAADSQCYGTVSQGRLTGGVQLPSSGANFAAYSALGTVAGRTYVHAKVADILAASYAALQSSSPDASYVYGETGWQLGGQFKPHRTHQNGLSVDFFVPVRNAAGQAVALPTSVANRLGYDIEFNAQGQFGDYRIDFAALADHLRQLHLAAKARGAGIALVIIEPAFLPKLFATPSGAYLQKNLSFMKAKPWVRHDEHYHVDFAIACKSM